MNRSKGENDNVENGTGDVRTITQPSTIHSVDRRGKDNKCAQMDDNNKGAQMDDEQENCVNMCNNLKKIITHIKEQIRLEKRNMKTQAENNLGSQHKSARKNANCGGVQSTTCCKDGESNRATGKLELGSHDV